MITRIEKLLLKLRADTGTPATSRNYLENPDVESFIERSFQRSSKHDTPDNLSYSDFEAVIIFILSLMDMRTNLEGAFFAKAPVVYMTDQVLLRVKATNDDSTEFRIIRDAWYFELDKEYKAGNQLLNHEPTYESCPLMTFHTVAHQASRQPDNTAPLYEAYAYWLHTWIRVNQNQPGIDLSTHLDYVRAARYFFVYMPDDIKAKQQHMPDDIPGYLKYFAKNRLGKSHITQETIDTQLWLFEGLVSGRTVKPHPRISSRTSHNVKILASSSPPDGASTGIATVPEFYIHGIPTKKPSDRYALLDAVQDFSFGYASFPGKTSLLTLPETSKTYINSMDYIHVRNFIFPWDAQFLNLFHLGILYHAMEVSKGEYERLRTVVLFLYFLIHTGIDAENLLDAIPAKEDLKDSAIGIKIIDGRYFVLNPRIIPLKADEDHSGCQTTSRHIYIPVPKIIADMIPDNALDRDSFFSYIKGDRETKINYYDVKGFLDHVNKTYSAYEISITMSYIENAFLPLYSSLHGLDPILCCHISGKDQHQIYGSQIHYIYIPADFLAGRYLATFSRVHDQIRSNFNECIDYGLIKGDEISLNIIEEPPLPDMTGWPGYGSTSTPTIDIVQNMVQSIQNAILRETNIMKRHNLLTCYLFLFIQFSTGYRPRSPQIIPWTRYNENSGVLVIQGEKDSADFFEQRLIPLPSTLRSMLKELREGLPILNDYIVRNLVFSDQTQMFNNILFLINDKGFYIDFTPDEMINILSKAGIDFPFPMNMPRHFLRNYLYHHGISNDLADAWMGHQHDGREMLNITSSTIVGDALLKCLAIVEDMVKQIGFENIA